jgi:hypothetical protein
MCPINSPKLAGAAEKGAHREHSLTKRKPARLKFQTQSLQYLFIFAVRQPAFGAPWRAWHNKKLKPKFKAAKSSCTRLVRRAAALFIETLPV